MRLTIDSFAWVEIIRGTPLGVEAGRLIEATERCFTPAVVLAEVAHRCLRDGLVELRVRHQLRAMRESSDLVPIDSDLVIAGSLATGELRNHARAHRLQTPGLADGLVLATARRMESRLLTCDPHFRGLKETVWLS